MDDSRTAIVTQEQLIEIRDQLIRELCQRAKTARQQDAIDDSVASVYLTSHLVCHYVGNPYTAMGATMSLENLADRIRADIEPVAREFQVKTVVETFGDTHPTVADARWMLALWSLLMDVTTSTPPDCVIEVNIGVCQNGFEIEVGYDDSAVSGGSRKTINVSGAFPHAFTVHWLRSICPQWKIASPACPLGGTAVQVSIPLVNIEQQQAAA